VLLVALIVLRTFASGFLSLAFLARAGSNPDEGRTPLVRNLINR
jgi:hypothetical protein